ncbi:hypothetical protein JXR93_14460 [bacterium]|nr:hypothetical protein [bacterium]
MIFNIYLKTIISIISLAILSGILGYSFDIDFLQKTHPFIFFIGFGNLSIIILNRYLISGSINREPIGKSKFINYIFFIVVAILITVLGEGLRLYWFKTISAMLLFYVVGDSLKNLFKELDIKIMWRDIAIRYYTFDLIFLLNAALGLFFLGIKESFGDLGVIPFFVNRSSYFLGSSFPLSISVMGFLHAYIIEKKRFFHYWFYTFIGGVLSFLVLILIKSYLGMMISSNILNLGVILIFIFLIKFMINFYKKNSHPTPIFLFGAIFFLIFAGVHGVLNIQWIDERVFGTVPQLKDKYMWNYHSHTHAALMGWILLSFLGIVYAVYDKISKNGYICKENIFITSIKNSKFIYFLAFLLILSMLFLLIGFYIDNYLLLTLSPLLYLIILLILLMNLIKNIKKFMQ